MIILAFVDLGPLSGHMVIHIATMNVAAPLAAAIFGRRHYPQWLTPPPGLLWPATVLQLALLWAAHSPAVHHTAQASVLFLTTLHLALFLSALAFWTCIVAATTSRWRAMFALMVSGKLACLLGALLIFAPRVLFDVPVLAHEAHAAHGDIASLTDQHLAGLLMVAACPLSYVLAAVVIAVQAVYGLEKGHSSPVPGARVAGGP